MLEINILSLLGNKEYFFKYKHLIKEHLLTKETIQILSDMEDWWKKDESKTDVDWNEFSEWFCLIKHPLFKADKLEMYKSVFNNISEIDKDKSFLEGFLQTLIQRDYAARISEYTQKIADGDDSIDIMSVEEILNEYVEKTGRVKEIDKHVLEMDIDKIIDTTSCAGLNWRLNELNLSIGPLRKGDLVVFGARPDTGKTTFLASEATFMAKQIRDDHSILWVNNEERGEKVQKRIIQAALGWTKEKMLEDRTTTLLSYVGEVGHAEKIKVMDKADVHITDVSEWLKHNKVGLIVFDQLWKVHGFEKESSTEVMRFQMLFQWARELAKKYGPVLDVHQARGDAEGNKWVYMNQFHNTQTVLQGEADAIITMGRSHEAGLEKSRYLYVPKNKMDGGEMSDSKYRNGKFEIEILPEIARFRSML